MSPLDIDKVATETRTLRDVEACFQQWLQMQDVEPLHVVLAAVTANMLPGDPFWLFLVAPPSGLKTELIRALNDIAAIYPLSSLTAQTFASGFQTKGASPSLLTRLDGRILTLKDFTTVLTMQRDKRAEILAQLREIYDGAYRKEFGNGVVVDWAGKVGLVAGVTPIVDTYTSVNQVLGERFLLYRMPADHAVTVARRAMRQQGNETSMREELRRIVAALFLPLVPRRVPIPEVILDRLAHLATFAARARSGVVWDQRGEISYVPEPEGPGRLAKQLATLAQGLAVIRGTSVVTDDDYLTVFRVAEDTVPAQRRAMLKPLLSGRTYDTAEIGEDAGYPTTTARRYLHELAAMDLVHRSVGGQGRADTWRLSTLAGELLDKAKPPENDNNLFSNVTPSVVRN